MNAQPAFQDWRGSRLRCEFQQRLHRSHQVGPGDLRRNAVGDSGPPSALSKLLRWIRDRPVFPMDYLQAGNESGDGAGNVCLCGREAVRCLPYTVYFGDGMS